MKIAVVVHLYYHDLWSEIADALENTRHLTPDVYVTLTQDKPERELAEMRARIEGEWPQAYVLSVPNRGADIGPFVEVARHIASIGRRYDLLLKLHAKRSLAASGADKGDAWRTDCLAALCGSPEVVDEIVATFSAHPAIGMIGPRDMLMSLSSNDQKAGRNLNAENMTALADRMGLSDRTLSFFRGSMFWARAEDVFLPILRGGLTIQDFGAGHAPDGTRAHAMERLFACMVRSAGRVLHRLGDDPPPISRTDALLARLRAKLYAEPRRLVAIDLLFEQEGFDPVTEEPTLLVREPFYRP